MNPLLGLIGGVLIAIVSAGGVYLGVRHKGSGSIQTSEAKELWDESKAIREAQRAEIERLERKNADQDAEIGRLEVELATVRGALAVVKIELERRR